MPQLDQIRTLSGPVAKHVPTGATAVAALVSQHLLYLLLVPLVMIGTALASDIVRVLQALTDGYVERIKINNAKLAKAQRADPGPRPILRMRRGQPRREIEGPKNDESPN